MRMWRSQAGVVGALALLACVARAGDGDDPSVAVQRVVKGLGKLESYRVEFEIDGGQAEGSEHRVVGSRIHHSWSADTWKGLSRIEAGVAWRPRANGSGAIKEGLTWKAILATQDGRLMERLFVRPEEVMARVLQLKKRAAWAPLAPGGQAGVAAALAELGDDEESPAGPTDGTQTRKKKGTLSSGQPKQSGPTGSSHRLQVEGPPQVALDQFTALQNSGCFEAG